MLRRINLDEEYDLIESMTFRDLFDYVMQFDKVNPNLLNFKCGVVDLACFIAENNEIKYNWLYPSEFLQSLIDEAKDEGILE